MKKLKKLKLKDVGVIMSENEMKMIKGGQFGGEITGVLCSEGSCYCDVRQYDGDIVYCEMPCDNGICESWGLYC